MNEFVEFKNGWEVMKEEEIKAALSEIEQRLAKGNHEYGDFNEEVARIVKAFKILRRRDGELTVDDYIVLMILTKIYRNYTSEKLDNILDVAGYAVLWYKKVSNRYK